jgi:hypothetical protein
MFSSLAYIQDRALPSYILAWKGTCADNTLIHYVAAEGIGAVWSHVLRKVALCCVLWVYGLSVEVA